MTSKRTKYLCHICLILNPSNTLEPYLLSLESDKRWLPSMFPVDWSGADFHLKWKSPFLLILEDLILLLIFMILHRIQRYFSCKVTAHNRAIYKCLPTAGHTLNGQLVVFYELSMRRLEYFDALRRLNVEGKSSRGERMPGLEHTSRESRSRPHTSQPRRAFE